MNHQTLFKTQTARLTESSFITEDAISLPVRQWLPVSTPHAVIIALHGFNDYSHSFNQAGKFFSSLGFACYAYDQRGFGNAPNRGLWAGISVYTSDLQTFAGLVKHCYPDIPVYVLGESMGGAIVISAISNLSLPDVAGVILAAPALWARETMPWYQTGLLKTLFRTMPALTLTGRGVKVKISDNEEILEGMKNDPLVIKATRVDAMNGLSDLMDEAFYSARRFRANTLILYGEKDRLIPKQPTYRFLYQFLDEDTTSKTAAIYPEGYHLLLRDLQAITVLNDIVAWINKNPPELPSGADNRAKQVLANWRF
jgi:alpha-beta hydrolase superfamily lysophospholipase